MHGYQKRPRIVRKIMEKKEIKMVNKIDYLKKDMISFEILTFLKN